MKNYTMICITEFAVSAVFAVAVSLPTVVCAQERNQAQMQTTNVQTDAVSQRQNDRRPKSKFISLLKNRSGKVAAEHMSADSLSGMRSGRNGYELGAVLPDSLAEYAVAAADSVYYDGAHIEFDETVWDFGVVARKGGDVVKEFVFVNNGSQPLLITGITVSCTCIKVVYPRHPVAAGGRESIKLIYEPHKMSPGAFYRVVQVHSNSVDGVRLLTVSGNSVEGRRIR